MANFLHAIAQSMGGQLLGRTAGAMGQEMERKRIAEEEAVRRQREADAQMQRQLAISSIQHQQTLDDNLTSYNRDRADKQTDWERTAGMGVFSALARENPAAAAQYGPNIPGVSEPFKQGLAGAAPGMQDADAAAIRLKSNVVNGLIQQGEWEQALGALKGVSDPTTRRSLAEPGITHWIGEQNFTKATEWADAGGDRQSMAWVMSLKEGTQQKHKADTAEKQKQLDEQVVQELQAKVQAVIDDPTRHTKAEGRSLWSEIVRAGQAGNPQFRGLDQILTEQFPVEEKERSTTQLKAAKEAAMQLPGNLALADSMRVDKQVAAFVDPAAARVAKADSIGRAYLAQNPNVGLPPAAPSPQVVGSNLTGPQQAVLNSRMAGAASPGTPPLSQTIGAGMFPGVGGPTTPAPAAADTIGTGDFEAAISRLVQQGIPRADAITQLKARAQAAGMRVPAGY